MANNAPGRHRGAFKRLTGTEQREVLLRRGIYIDGKSSLIAHRHLTLWKLGLIYVQMMTTDTTIISLEPILGQHLQAAGWQVAETA